MPRSRRTRHRKVCWRKLKQSQAVAINAANVMTGRYGVLYLAYECRWCLKWHVGKALSESPAT